MNSKNSINMIDIDVNKNKIVNIFISIVGIMIMQVINEMNNFVDIIINQKIILTLAIIVFAFILISSYMYIGKIDLYMILIAISFLFLFGRHILLIIDVITVDKFLRSWKISLEAVNKTGYFVLQCILSINIGYVLIRKKYNSKKSILSSVSIINEANTLYKSALFFFVISIVPTLYTLYSKVVASITQGYGARIIDSSNSINDYGGVIGVIGGFTIPALIAMLISNKEQYRRTIILFAIYLILYTLSGSRINTFCLLITILFIRSTWYNKPIRKNFIKVAILCVGIVFIFSVVSDVRGNLKVGNISYIISSSIKNIWENNFLFSALNEMGQTFSVIACVLQNSPSIIPHLNGISYIASFIYIMPNFLTGNLVTNYKFVDEAFSEFLVDYGGIGSSYIAEAYYNFGNFTIVFMIIYGMIWAFWSNKCEKYIIRKNSVAFFLCMYLFSIFIFSVRSDMVYNFRSFVWFGIPIVIISKFLLKIKIVNK